MKNRLPVFLFAALMAAPMLLSTPVQAQDRGEDTWYLRPRVGMSYYTGTNDPTFAISSNGDLFNSAPLNAALEVGYRYGPKWSAGVALSFSTFGNINDFLQDDAENGYESGEAVALMVLARRNFGSGKIQPFINLGAGLNFTNGNQRDQAGYPEEFALGFGPMGGWGFDIRMTDRVSLGLETGGMYVFPDAAADGAGDTLADWLGWNTVSLGFDLKKFIPVMISDVICPVDVVDTGAPVTFTGSVNMDATPLVESSWDFGDGTIANGMTATHSFSQEGTYNVAFAVSNGNGRGMDSRTCVVTVEDPCEAAVITSMTASNMAPDTRSNVSFLANTSGTAPVGYSWNFGDGNTSTSSSPSHTYSEAGTYTVTLEVTNCGGMVSRTMTIVVVPFEAAICREIEEMNSAFFARNSSTLTEAGRAALQDNLEILLECPNLNARVEGWAAPGERRPQQLSEDRARAVEQFYVDNGVAASRLVTAGMGRAQGVTSKKEGLEGFRRVDTIPVRM
jgi:PKD repeat protein